jgi:hypothetical protein
VILGVIISLAVAKDSTWKVNIGEEANKQADLKDKSASTLNLLDPNDYVEDIKNGDELKELLTHKKDKIIVIVWYKNEYGHFYLNRNNQETRGALINIIDKNHPNVVYHEVDMSEYNLNSPTYEDLAKELGIDLKMLYDAPIALVVYSESGDAFTTDKGSLSLVKMVEKYLQKIEKEEFGTEHDLSNEEEIIQGVTNFNVPSVLELEKKYKEQHKNSIPKKEIKESSSTTKPKTVKPSEPKEEKNKSVVETKLASPESNTKAKITETVKPTKDSALKFDEPSKNQFAEAPFKAKVAQAQNPQISEIVYPEPNPIQGKLALSSAYPRRIAYSYIDRPAYPPFNSPVFRNPGDDIYRNGW